VKRLLQREHELALVHSRLEGRPCGGDRNVEFEPRPGRLRQPLFNPVESDEWLRGEELMAGRAAVVTVDMHSGRIVLFGLRPQHRAQTHATFPLLFNALYLATSDRAAKSGS